MPVIFSDADNSTSAGIRMVRQVINSDFWNCRIRIYTLRQIFTRGSVDIDRGGEDTGSRGWRGEV